MHFYALIFFKIKKKYFFLKNRFGLTCWVKNLCIFWAKIGYFCNIFLNSLKKPSAYFICEFSGTFFACKFLQKNFCRQIVCFCMSAKKGPMYTSDIYLMLYLCRNVALLTLSQKLIVRPHSMESVVIKDYLVGLMACASIVYLLHSSHCTVYGKRFCTKILKKWCPNHHWIWHFRPYPLVKH